MSLHSLSNLTTCHFIRLFKLFTLNVIIGMVGLKPIICFSRLFPLSSLSLFELIDYNLWFHFVSCIILLAILPFWIFFLMAAFRFTARINPVSGSLTSGNIIQLHTWPNNPVTAYFHFSLDHTLCVCMYIYIYIHMYIYKIKVFVYFA